VRIGKQFRIEISGGNMRLLAAFIIAFSVGAFAQEDDCSKVDNSSRGSEEVFVCYDASGNTVSCDSDTVEKRVKQE
jgi:hypothetical protein